MKKTLLKLGAFGAFVATMAMPVAVYATTPTPAPASAVVYDATPNPLPPNVPSEGFEANAISEFGDYVHLGGDNRILNKVNVTMSDWALYSQYSADTRYMANTQSWTHPITVNIYNKAADSNKAGTLLATKTEDVTIPWRPAGDDTCPISGDVHGYIATDGKCYNGKAFNASFDMSSLNVTLPNDVIVGVAFNTADYGATPLHQPGPYNSLNVGIPDDQPVTVGTDDNVDNVYMNTSNANNYTDKGVTGVFREDTNWKPNGTVAFQITATAPPVVPPAKTVAMTKDDCNNGNFKNHTNDKGKVFTSRQDCIDFVNRPKHSTVIIQSSDPNGVNIATVRGSKYRLTVSGVWTNRQVEKVDAECTSYNGGKWKNAVTGGYNANLLDVQISKAFVNWGDCNKKNTYTKTVVGTGASINLRVFDGDTKTNTVDPSWYGDNVGTLSVAVTEYPKQ